MSDFLTRMALRQLGQIATIEPRVAPLYGTAKETRNSLLAEDLEYRPVTTVPEPMSERTPTHEPGRLVDGEADPAISPKQPLVQAKKGSHRPIPGFYTAESGSKEPGPFTVDESSPGGFSTAEPPERFSGRPTTRAESVSRQVASPPILTVPVLPPPLVQTSRPGLPERSNEFTPPVILSSEEDRRAKGAQRDQENPVHVTIGRIEVTATTAVTPAKRVSARKQTMSLEDYLARRQRSDR